MDYLKQTLVLGNSLWDYLIVLGTFIIGIILILIFKSIALSQLNKWAEKTKTSFDNFVVLLIQRIIIPLVYFGVFIFSVKTLTLAPSVKKTINTFAMAVTLFFIARFATDLLNYLFRIYSHRRKLSEATRNSLDGLLRITKLIVWILLVILFLDNLGFKVSGIIAGLGIGGVAVALAAQAVLGDLFSYFSILFDRPFEIGDFIIVGDFMGVVQHVGIKTTRIISLGGEQIIFSNSDLTNSRVRNYKRMEKRRVVFKLGVVYSTPLEKLKEISKLIESTIKGIEDTAFDRAHFFNYGDFSLIFEVVYYVMSSDYNKYMDIQQEINFGINQKFKEKGIEFAYPTQTLYVNK